MNRMITIGDRVRLAFSPLHGGALKRDSLGLIGTTSIEVHCSTDHPANYSQSYKCQRPKITHGSDWLRSKGHLRSLHSGYLPVSYDILTEIDDLDITINFSLLFEDSLTNVMVVKSWMFINAIKCLVKDAEGIKKFSLLTKSKKFQPVYRGTLNEATFTNLRGSFKLLSKQSSCFVEDRIWKQREHAECITVWLSDSPQTIEKGRMFECTWKLRYSEVT